MPNKDEQITFSEQIVYSMTKPTKYKNLLELGKGRFVLFVIVMMSVLSIITYVVPTAAVIAGFGGFNKLFTEELPAISSKDGNLVCEQPYKMTFNDYTVLIDTSEPSISDDKLDKAGVYVAVGSESVRLVTVGVESKYEYKTIDFKGNLSDDLSNEKLKVFTVPIYIALVFTCVSMVAVFFLKYAFFALLLGFIFRRVIKKDKNELPTGKLFTVCFYGQTLGYLLVNCNDAMKELIPYSAMSLVAIIITCITIKTALLDMFGQLPEKE